MEKFANTIKEQLRSGKVLCGVAVSLSDPAVSELVGLNGYDFVWIEGEHGAFSRRELQNHMMAAHAGNAAALVRLTDHTPAQVKPVLDMGPDIICFPTINTVADAEAVVQACSYPPRGVRGCNPQRAACYGRMDYVDYVRQAESETLRMIVIEQQAGYKNLADILKVPGIDIVALGPGDLSLDMGFAGDMTRPEIQSLLTQAAALCKQEGKPFAVFPPLEEHAVKRWVTLGASMLIFSQDTTFITQAINRLWQFYDAVVPADRRTNAQ